MDFYLLILLLFIVAFLYSSVGHGGASGYLAVMALMSVAPALMKPSALLMNLGVSLFSFYGFYRAGFFRWKLFLPFAIASIPMSYLGATITIPDPIYKKLLAVCILISIIRLLIQPVQKQQDTKEIPRWAALLIGATIGLLSGMLGIGGGIILSPLFLLFRWGTLKETAAVSAIFIFVNSVSGLFGLWQKGFEVSPEIIQWLVAVGIGGLLGSYFGSQKFNVPTLRYILAVVLVIACLKLVLV